MEEKIHYQTCNICEAMCGLEIKTQATEIISIKGDLKDSFSRGHLCPKAFALQDIYEDPDRLKFPVQKIKDRWETISWEKAFDLVVDEITKVQKKYGKDALAIYLGNPNVHSLGAVLFLMPFLKSLRTQQRYSATSVDQLPHHLMAYMMFGHQLLLPIPDIDRTQFLLILGANPLVSNGSIMTAPDIKNRLISIQKRGGEVILLDPRKTETAKLANEHYFIQPGTDVLFLLALLHTIFQEKLEKPGRLKEISEDLTIIPTLVAPFSPETVESQIGIPAKDIRLLAQRFCQASTAVCYGRLGVSVQEFGTLCQWLITVINIVTGNFDNPGGAMFTKPAVDMVDLLAKLGLKGSFAKQFSRIRNIPAFEGDFPVATLAEEIREEGKGQIKAMLICAGNPVLSTPNGKQLAHEFSKLDFLVAIDFYINETTNHANIILPPAPALENSFYDLIFHSLAIRNTAKFSEPVFTSEQGTKKDWEIFLELQTRFEAKNPLKRISSRLKKSFLQYLGPEGILRFALELGPYGKKWIPFKKGLTLKKLKQNPHGIDLGPLEPCLPKRLYTATKKIKIAPEPFVQDLTRVQEKFFQSPKRHPFLLIGRRDLRSNNSWLHNSIRFNRGKNRCTLFINPKDAANFKLSNEDQVQVSSTTGSVILPIEITEDIMPGVLSIPHGWGHQDPKNQLNVAKEHPGVSINDLTDPLFIDQLSGNAALNGIPVELKQIKNKNEV